MLANILRNWKTSVAAAITAVGVLLKVVWPTRGEIIDRAADVFITLGPILGLLFAKDGDLSGTATKPNP
jgi:preprotein translocase subunit SecE